MTSARSPSRPRAVIAGGSLSGLFAATTLLAAGWDVALFERSPGALDSRGGGIVLQPDVLAAFRFAGIPHGGALGVRSGDRIYLGADDQVLHRTDTCRRPRPRGTCSTPRCATRCPPVSSMRASAWSASSRPATR